MPNRTPRTTTQKRLGHDHQQQRNRLLARHVDGQPCWWCGKPMYRDRTRNWDHNPNATRSDGKPDTSSGSLAADHSTARAQSTTSRADRLLHGTCNKQRQGGHRDDQRPALTNPPDTDPALGTRIFNWP
ncbi:hypothetical protein BAB79_02780 [Mycobacteroides abscessus]|nr:hypothetical protein A3O06_02785 [Mycobacteroides abscessus]ANO22655.1 hypothetical protein BAB79_02780 [Mycobacteroides abscessus]